jgi:hypothetical protein
MAGPDAESKAGWAAASDAQLHGAVKGTVDAAGDAAWETVEGI